MTGDIASRYTICGCDDVLAALAKKDYAAVISIEHPGAKDGDGRAPRLSEHSVSTTQHLLTFWDNDIEELADMFTDELATQSLDLLRRYCGQRVLIHCKAGKARSAGVALMGIADEMGFGWETEAVALLERIRPIATPNPLVVRRADQLLQRDGALIAAVAASPTIQARMPDYIEAKLRGIKRYGHYDPEKAVDLLGALGPERSAEILRRLEAQVAPR